MSGVVGTASGRPCPSDAADTLARMRTRRELQLLLEKYYRGCGWAVEAVGDGTVRASGAGGVTWIGLPVTADDLLDSAFEQTLLRLSAERMPDGRLCPLELLPEEACASDLRTLLARLRLDDRGHVEVYSLAA